MDIKRAYPDFKRFLPLVRFRVDFVSCLKIFTKLFGQDQVDIPPSEVRVRGSRQHFQLAFVESASGNLQRAVAAIDEEDVARLFLRRREVLFVNAVRESRRRRLVH